MFYLVIILIIIQLVLFVSSVKSSGKWANIRFVLGVLLGGLIIWIEVNDFQFPKELTNHTSESR